MKLKNRIIVGFMMVILVPLLLFAAALFGISETQHRNAANSESAQETSYDITISDTGSSQARIQIMTKDLFLLLLSFLSSQAFLWGCGSTEVWRHRWSNCERRRRTSKKEIWILFWMSREPMNFRSFAGISKRCAAG